MQVREEGTYIWLDEAYHRVHEPPDYTRCGTYEQVALSRTADQDRLVWLAGCIKMFFVVQDVYVAGECLRRGRPQKINTEPVFATMHPNRTML